MELNTSYGIVAHANYSSALLGLCKGTNMAEEGPINLWWRVGGGIGGAQRLNMTITLN